MAIPIAVIMGAIQLAKGFIDNANNKSKAPIDTLKDPVNDGVGAKYENIFKSLADKAASGELLAADKFITQNRINTVDTANSIYSNPITRFKTSLAASGQADEQRIKAGLSAENTRMAYLGKAAEMGLSEQAYKNRIWNDLMRKKLAQQDLYNTRQEASGDLINAGIHNVVGGLDEGTDSDTTGDKTEVIDTKGDGTVKSNITTVENKPDVSKMVKNNSVTKRDQWQEEFDSGQTSLGYER